MMSSKWSTNTYKRHGICKMSTAGALILCSLVQLSIGQNSCRTPDNRNGNCISIHNCPRLLTLIQQRPLPAEDRIFAQKSQCRGGTGQAPHVCCTPNDSVSGNVQIPTPASTAAGAGGEGVILPSAPRCGQAAIGDRIYNGNDTLLDEFAWMVLLEYAKGSSKPQINCAGSLINQRYVLTAAHCLTGAILQASGKLVSVRLGEYDKSKPIDCIGNDCADPIVTMGIEESIPHPEYDDSSSNRQNDIGLIRLDRVVTYSDFIKPVCLPSALGLQPSIRTGTNLIVAGWGRTLNSRQSDIKQKLYIPLNDFEQCSQKFAAKRVHLSTSQLCVGGKFTEDSCDGDSGGPLMMGEDATNYAIVGIVSFGNKCGLEGWPGIYTKVSDYEDWIRSTLRP
ncbi:serine protease 7-like [Eupeodes corollae]|uniref:serine protease 7-like n=1 Tax=Eupeodes corollae TaxID=290404 RepID=UPI002491955D|nr:serine protease 7-like [Eupeodes corollae]